MGSGGARWGQSSSRSAMLSRLETERGKYYESMQYGVDSGI